MTPELQALIDGSSSAAWVFPVAGRPVLNGCLSAVDGRVSDLRPAERSVDWPTSAIVPMTVNLHTHRELSDVGEVIGVGLPLERWVLKVIGHRSRRSAVAAELPDFAESSAVLDIAQPSGASGNVASRIIEAVELLGLDRNVATNRLDEILVTCPAAISPHSPYSLHPEVTDAAVAAATDRGLVVTTHLAESPVERRLLQAGDGPLRETLQTLGVWQAEIFGGRTIADELKRLERSPRLVIGHGNDLRPSEFETLARPNAAVAFCPRTHHFFGYRRHPVVEMTEAGVRVGLGTDSLASNPDLSVWNEITFLARSRPDIPRETMLRMGTQNGAEALGLEDRIGTLEPGREAKFLIVPLSRPDATDPYEALFG